MRKSPYVWKGVAEEPPVRNREPAAGRIVPAAANARPQDFLLEELSCVPPCEEPPPSDPLRLLRQVSNSVSNFF